MCNTYSRCAACSLLDGTGVGNESFPEVKRTYLLTVVVYPSILAHNYEFTATMIDITRQLHSIKIWPTVLDFEL